MLPPRTTYLRPLFFLLVTFASQACGSGTGLDSEGDSASPFPDPATSSSGSSAQGGGGGAPSTSSTSSDGGANVMTAASSSSGTGGAPSASCMPSPACDATPPAPSAKASWNHPIESPLIVGSGSPHHRGRDLFLNPGDPQWIIAKFAYGLLDKDLKEEDVDVYLLRDCGSSWEMLGTAVTTGDKQHPTIEGVDDSGGRIYFPIPSAKALGLGRHRVHLVVKGDLSSTDLFIDVVPQGTPVFVSDVDGTLTTKEVAEFGALLTGKLPEAHPFASEALRTLAEKGYHAMYLTARPEWLTARTREFLDDNGFPPGIVHTTLTLTGATGASAASYKTQELAMLAAKGMVPAFGFGNTASDADAYENAHIEPVFHRIFFQFDDTKHGGRRIESYGDLLVEFKAQTSLCP